MTAIKERYRNNIGYLFKKKDNIKGAKPNREWEQEGIPFNYNIETIKKKVFNPISGTYKWSAQQVIKTDTQLLIKHGVEFDEYDRISSTPTPRNDANYQDYSLIDVVDKKSINESGNRYRKQEYWSYIITLQ